MSTKVLGFSSFPPLVDPDEGPWAAYLRREVFRRRQIAAVTYGIEVLGISIMLERDWDRIAQSIDPGLGTGHPIVDEFFRARFSPLTTSWVHDHPELGKVKEFFERYQLIIRGHFDFTGPRYQSLTKQKC